MIVSEPRPHPRLKRQRLIPFTHQANVEIGVWRAARRGVAEGIGVIPVTAMPAQTRRRR